MSEQIEIGLDKIIAMVQQLNIDCAKNGETVVPLTAENAEYYDELLLNLDYLEIQIEAFNTWIKTQ